MPYVKTVANVAISAEKRDAMARELGELMPILGKSESWLMVDFCENSPLYFKGGKEPAALVTVDLFGAADDAAYAEMTAAVTRLVQNQLNVPADRIYVKYGEYSHWGWNGTNF